MTDSWTNAASAHSLRFLVDFSVYEPWSLGALDASKHNVFLVELL